MHLHLAPDQPVLGRDEDNARLAPVPGSEQVSGAAEGKQIDFDAQDFASSILKLRRES